jgi:hypothetical protein
MENVLGCRNSSRLLCHFEQRTHFGTSWERDKKDIALLEKAQTCRLALFLSLSNCRTCTSSCVWSIPFCIRHKTIWGASYATSFFSASDKCDKNICFCVPQLSLMLNLFVREFSLSQNAISAQYRVEGWHVKMFWLENKIHLRNWLSWVF